MGEAQGHQQIATCGALGIWNEDEKEWEWEGCGEIPAAQYHPIVSSAFTAVFHQLGGRNRN